MSRGGGRGTLCLSTEYPIPLFLFLSLFLSRFLSFAISFSPVYNLRVSFLSLSLSLSPSYLSCLSLPLLTPAEGQTRQCCLPPPACLTHAAGQTNPAAFETHRSKPPSRTAARQQHDDHRGQFETVFDGTSKPHASAQARPLPRKTPGFVDIGGVQLSQSTLRKNTADSTQHNSRRTYYCNNSYAEACTRPANENIFFAKR